MDKLARLYIDNVVRLYGVPISIISDCDSRFTSKFWGGFQKAMGSWDEHISLIEFASNNNYQTTIGMAPFEAQYGKKSRTPLYWDEVGERRILGPELIQVTSKKVDLICERIKAAQSRQKGYADQCRKDLEFTIGDKILAKIKSVGYQLDLTPSLDGVHDVFHVSMLRMYVHDPSHVLSQEPHELIAIMSYKEQPEKILDSKIVNFCNRPIYYVKVKWCNHPEEEASWEVEVEMRAKYPSLGYLQDDGYLASLKVKASSYDDVGATDPETVTKEHGDGCPYDDCAYRP
ncbi:uncharacterized protein LOC122655320 [Telopea speciosissima]|uniref:uncharacterized protein LOC122655320 n=1 Tax=Telopea speciosissima TaxID=54955 RepID=UPI001CC5FB23|nr:uncharacterized protein LOC122655320 [Telopea speciosissima]